MIEEDIEFNEDGSIVDCLDSSLLQDSPEERVRQRFIKTLQADYGYPKYLIRREVFIQSGSKILLDENDGNPIRADIVVYNSKTAAIKKDQGNVLFVVECKQPTRQDGYTQLVSYIFNTSLIPLCGRTTENHHRLLYELHLRHKQ